VDFKILSKEEFDNIKTWEQVLIESNISCSWSAIRHYRIANGNMIKMNDYTFYREFIIPTFGTKLGRYLHGQ
jgi:hypothetical protein